MFHAEEVSDNVYIARLLSPRNKNDAENFFLFLETLEHKKNFFLIFESEGEARFSGEDKKRMTLWFKNNKAMLANSCLGFARIRKNVSPLSKLTSKAMRLAMPCPYEVFPNLDQTLAWVKNIEKGSR